MGVSNTKDALFVCLWLKRKHGISHCNIIFHCTRRDSLLELQTKCERAYEYLLKIPIAHWWNTQWEITRKVPLPERLPSRYGVVTSNTSECINSMIEDYRSEGWTEMVKGMLCHMTQRISNERQTNKAKRQDEIVPKVKAILADRFAKAAAMEVVELVHRKQYMVTEKRGSTLNINLTAHQQVVVMEDVNGGCEHEQKQP